MPFLWAVHMRISLEAPAKKRGERFLYLGSYLSVPKGCKLNEKDLKQEWTKWHNNLYAVALLDFQNVGATEGIHWGEESEHREGEGEDKKNLLSCKMGTMTMVWQTCARLIKSLLYWWGGNLSPFPGTPPKKKDIEGRNQSKSNLIWKQQLILITLRENDDTREMSGVLPLTSHPFPNLQGELDKLLED